MYNIEDIQEYLINVVGLSPRHKGTIQLAEGLQIVLKDRDTLYSVFMRVCEPIAVKHHVNPKSVHKNMTKVLHDSKIEYTPTEFLFRESIKYKKYVAPMDVKHGESEEINYANLWRNQRERSQSVKGNGN